MEFDCDNCGVVFVLSDREMQEKIREYVDGDTCACCFCDIPYKYKICDDCLEEAHQARSEY